MVSKTDDLLKAKQKMQMKEFSLQAKQTHERKFQKKNIARKSIYFPEKKFYS